MSHRLPPRRLGAPPPWSNQAGEAGALRSKRPRQWGELALAIAATCPVACVFVVEDEQLVVEACAAGLAWAQRGAGSDADQVRFLGAVWRRKPENTRSTLLEAA